MSLQLNTAGVDEDSFESVVTEDRENPDVTWLEM